MGLFDAFRKKENSDEVRAKETRFTPDQLMKTPDCVPEEERYALALAAPFRSIFLYMDEKIFPYQLFALKMLTEKERRNLEKAMKSSFRIVDAESMLAVMSDTETAYAQNELKVFGLSVQIHQLLSCIDLGYVEWDTYRDVLDETMRELIYSCTSWEDFAKQFAKGHQMSGNVSVNDLHTVHKKLKWLLDDENSPWQKLIWPVVPEDYKTENDA